MTQKRTFVVFVVLCVSIVGCTQMPAVRVDKVKPEPAYRAAKTIESSIGVGVNYQKFSELLQQFNTELSIAHDRSLTPAEREIVDFYAQAIPMYRDSLSLWALKIEKGQYLSDYGQAKDIADKYELPRESTTTINSEAGIRTIWAKAGDSLAKGNASYSKEH